MQLLIYLIQQSLVGVHVGPRLSEFLLLLYQKRLQRITMTNQSCAFATQTMCVRRGWYQFLLQALIGLLLVQPRQLQCALKVNLRAGPLYHFLHVR